MLLALLLSLTAVATPSLEVVAPQGVDALTSRLIEVESAIRDPELPDATVATLGHAQQRIYRVLADDRATGDAVIAKLPPELKTPVTKGVAAVRGHAAIVRTPRADLPAWHIEVPAPVAELEGYYREGEAKSGVPWSLLAAVHLIETRFGRMRATSYSGAQGPMQFMPPTWAAYGLGGDVQDTHDAILGAANYLAKMGAPKDVDKAIWAYNHHTGYVTAVREVAEVIAAEPATLRAFHGWEAYYFTPRGWLWLPVGYTATERQPIAPFCEKWGQPYCP